MQQVPDPGSSEQVQGEFGPSRLGKGVLGSSEITQGEMAAGEIRPPRPAQPQDDLAGRPWQGGVGGLGPDHAAFVQAGVSICIGARDALLQPVAGLGLACRPTDETRLRIVLRKRGNERLLAAIASGSPLAVTFTQPTTHRSIQLKAAQATLAAPEPEDEPHRARQHLALRDELVAIGYSGTLATTYRACEGEEVAVIVFAPETAFVQTPGPGAGSRLP